VKKKRGLTRPDLPKDLRSRHNQLKRTFGISIEDYEVLATVQKECCAICDIPQHYLKRSLAVDHDHATGKVRGLLCHHCNLFLGKIEANLDLADRCKKYLYETSHYLQRVMKEARELREALGTPK
jgi:hypothetical protein